MIFHIHSLFFFLMSRRPPRSTLTDTLFPYTTLFRSRLAERFGLRFADADRDIELRTGASVGTIFDCEGEAGFRARESATLAQLLKMRSEEHTSELQSLMRISYAVFCLKKKK